jgi:hypothetical protein
MAAPAALIEPENVKEAAQIIEADGLVRLSSEKSTQKFVAAGHATRYRGVAPRPSPQERPANQIRATTGGLVTVLPLLDAVVAELAASS